MFNLLSIQAGASCRETFRCGNCRQDFEATVITWVDVSKTPQAKHALLKWGFNSVPCTHCGSRNFSGSPFYYEDFEEGLLVAVFPGIPDKRDEVETAIRAKFGYYPVLEFFYDMTQIWMLIYFLEHYRINKNLRALSRIGRGEERLRRILRFLKEDPLMITIREKLADSILSDGGNDDLVEVLGQAVYTLEEMLPWPMDKRCVCGADLAEGFRCCNRRVNLAEHERLLSRQYAIYCPVCKESLSGASCEKCGRVYTWKLGRVASYKRDDGDVPRTADRAEQGPRAQL
jgi:CpXC protein